MFRGTVVRLPDIPAALAVSVAVAARIREAFSAADRQFATDVRIDLDGLPPLPARLVRWLVLQAIPALNGTVVRLTLSRARVSGQLNLAHAKLSVTPCFAACTFLPGDDASDLGIDLTDATLAGIEVIGGNVGLVRADRLNAAGTVLLRGARPDPTYRHELPPDAEASVAIPHGILLSGARIRGNLDLRGAHVGPLRDGPQGAVVALLADGLSLEGNLLFSDGAHANGELRLNGSRIQRNLDCTAASLINPHGYSLSAAGAEVAGTVYLCGDHDGAATHSVGTLRLEGMHIRGDLDAKGGFFTATAFYVDGWQCVRQPATAANVDDVVAFSAVGLTVDASIRLCGGCSICGSLDLTLAKIGGDLQCSDACFHLPGEEVIFGDGIEVSGCSYFIGSRTTGLIRFVLAQLKQGCVFDDFVFDLGYQSRGWTIAGSPVQRELRGGDLCGVYAAGAVVGGSFVWTKVSRCAPHAAGGGATDRVMWLSVPGAVLTEVSDDEQSWQAVDRTDLRNCAYQKIDGLTTDITWRLTRLDREYAQWNTHEQWGRARLAREILRRTWRQEHYGNAGLGEQIRRFVPGPYLQLARLLREAGFESAAQTVLLRLERNRARYSGLPIRTILWRWLIDATLLYGLSPFRPVLFVLGWGVISGILFKWVHDTRLPDGQRAMHAIGVADHVTFNWFFYALDTLVPFVDFDQKKHFVIDPMWSLGGALFLLNTILGYAAASFLAAGLSGLVRTGKDGG